VNFNETVVGGANVAANYEVYPTSSPASQIGVISASPGGQTVQLTLAGNLESGTSYTVRVNNVQDAAGNAILPNSTVSFIASSVGGFEVTGVFQFGKDYVGVAFSQRVNSTTATNIDNYAFSPSLSLESAVVQENGQTVVLKTAADLPLSTTYSVTVTGVTGANGGVLTSSGPFGMTTTSFQVTNIADIHAMENLPALEADEPGIPMAVVGQVFIPTGSRGGTPSGYIQDGSGRGLNIFGSGATAATNQLGSVVAVDGEVGRYFETVELENFTATTLASSQPHLGARQLTVAEANSPAWEGTYIEVSAVISQIITEGVGGAVNYNVEGGGAVITIRIDNDLGINANDFQVGEAVTGRGAGGAFQSTFQVLVGNVVDFQKVGDCEGDTEPPFLTGASGAGGESTVQVTYSEPVDRTTGENTANYEVFETDNPQATLGVQRVTLEGSVATLRLDGNLQLALSYTVRVSNVADLCDNLIAEGSTVTFTTGESKPTTAKVTVPSRTLLRNLEEIDITIEGEDGARAVCRIFDSQGRLVKVILDDILPLSNPVRTWDGRDETFELVRAGMYICHLKTTTRDGNVTVDQAPIVVSVRLQ
jgi:hypothetical protein